MRKGLFCHNDPKFVEENRKVRASHTDQAFSVAPREAGNNCSPSVESILAVRSRGCSSVKDSLGSCGGASGIAAFSVTPAPLWLSCS